MSRAEMSRNCDVLDSHEVGIIAPNIDMLIICDFDGTITERDVTDLVWNGRIPQTERDAMVSNVLEGRWSMIEYIAHGYGFVRTKPSDLLRELQSKVQIRKGWERFLASVQRHHVSLHIVSNGLRFYIREYVPVSVPVTCYDAEFDGAYRAKLPDGVELRDGEEFKVKSVRELIARHRHEQVVYIGDGRADFQPALLCHSIFAVRESRLAGECRSHAIAMVEFDSFDTITDCLFPKLGVQLGA